MSRPAVAVLSRCWVCSLLWARSIDLWFRWISRLLAPRLCGQQDKSPTLTDFSFRPELEVGSPCLYLPLLFLGDHAGVANTLTHDMQTMYDGIFKAGFAAGVRVVAERTGVCMQMVGRGLGFPRYIPGAVDYRLFLRRAARRADRAHHCCFCV